MTKTEITLDSLMKANALTDSISTDKAVLTQQVEQKVAELSEEDRQRVNEIKQEIDMQDSTLLTVYGSDSQKNIAQFSDTILAEVRSKDVGDVEIGRAHV